jgi:hypothetical protein
MATRMDGAIGASAIEGVGSTRNASSAGNAGVMSHRRTNVSVADE